MKSLKILLIVLLLGSLFSCENAEWEFDDFDYTAVYFPYQYPVRTLVLGDYEYDNENDKNLKFLITARIGGMYENKKEWVIDYEVNEQLVENLKSSNGDTIRLLPQEYYQLNPLNQMIVPQGQFQTSIEVQLTDDFLNDPMAIGLNYVIPLQITSTTADSILLGSPDVENPDPRIGSNWVIRPKNFTLFGIKYVNPYHGKYLHRGRSVISNLNNEPYDTVVYRQQYIVEDEIWALETISKNTVAVSSTIRASAGSPGSLLLNLDFNESTGDCVVTNSPDSEFTISGTGKFVQNGDTWGDKDRNAIYLNYQIEVGTDIHNVTDTLVIRDRDVRFEEFNPVVYSL